MKNIKKIGLALILIVSVISMHASSCNIGFTRDQKLKLAQFKKEIPELFTIEEQQKIGLINYPTTPSSLYKTESNFNSGDTTRSNMSYDEQFCTSLSDTYEKISYQKFYEKNILSPNSVAFAAWLEPRSIQTLNHTKKTPNKIINKRLHPSLKLENLQGLSQQTAQTIQLKQGLTIAQKELSIMQTKTAAMDTENRHYQRAAQACSMIALGSGLGWLVTLKMQNVK